MDITRPFGELWFTDSIESDFTRESWHLGFISKVDVRFVVNEPPVPIHEDEDPCVEGSLRFSVAV